MSVVHRAGVDRQTHLAEKWQEALRRGHKQDLAVQINPFRLDSFFVTSSNASAEPYEVDVNYAHEYTTCTCTGANTHGYCKHQALVREHIGWLVGQ